MVTDAYVGGSPRLRRDLRARAEAAPPAPSDLSERTRARRRTLRRREYGLAAPAVTVALVLVGVPVVASTTGPAPDRGQVAMPSGSGRLLPPEEGIYQEPTRGGLSDDEEWLADVAALPWPGGGENRYRDPGMELSEPSEPPQQTRRVAYADDAPSGRVALVVGLSGREVVHAWFVGPRGADPDQMGLAGYPGVYGTDVVGLVDGEQDAQTLTLVVVARPGHVVERQLVPVVDENGDETPAVEPLALVDGIAVAEVDRTWAEAGTDLSVQRARDFLDRGRHLRQLPGRADRPPVGRAGRPARPDRAVRAEPVAGHQHRAPAAAVRPGRSPGGADPARRRSPGRAAGRRARGAHVPLGGDRRVWRTVSEPARPDNGVTVYQLPFAPAGTDLLDRVLAAHTQRGLVVTAPAGVRADVLTRPARCSRVCPWSRVGEPGPCGTRPPPRPSEWSTRPERS